MEEKKGTVEPNNTAVRTALWRAMHVQIDAKPHVLDDEIGFKLVAPAEDWQQRPDMNPVFSRRVRASMVARARFIEDLVAEQVKLGVCQYVILGAGLDSFAQRQPEIASKLTIFEIDQPGTQTWKKQRLIELGYGIPEWLRFVSVDFEAGSLWWEELLKSGFDPTKRTVLTCTGLSMYLTTEANKATLQQIATLAPGSVLAMTYMLPLELIEVEDHVLQTISEKGARASGNPFISFFSPNEILDFAREAGFVDVKNVSASDLNKLYFTGRSDNLSPASGEGFLIATI
jgi:methyltransferase (TIGR00027 family)